MAVASWKITKNIAGGVKKVADIAKVRKQLERIKNLGRKRKDEEPKPPPAAKPDSSFDFNTRPERIDHTFAPKHKLDGIVERAGGREEARSEQRRGGKERVCRGSMRWEP